MATSGSSNWSTTRDEIIKYALLNVGAIGQAETPSATAVTDAAFLLNTIIKHWSTEMPLFTKKQTSFSLVDGTASYTVGTGATVSAVGTPLVILNAFLRDASGDPDSDRPLAIIAREDYEKLSLKAQEGAPTQLFYDRRGGNTSTGILYLYPTPGSYEQTNCTCYITYHRPIEDFDAAGDEPDITPEWVMPLVWQLSWALSGSYGVPLQERTMWRQEALQLKNEILMNDREHPGFTIQPDWSR